MVEAASDVLSVDDVDGLGHVQDFGLPVVLPAGFGPEQTLISDFEHHLNKIISISDYLSLIRLNFNAGTPEQPKHILLFCLSIHLEDATITYLN